jgi:hypothetical protein
MLRLSPIRAKRSEQLLVLFSRLHQCQGYPLLFAKCSKCTPEWVMWTKWSAAIEVQLQSVEL